MTEQEFINQQQAKCDKKLLRQLKQIDQKGFASRKVIDLLWQNDLIRGCGPRPEINHPYNGYRLSEKGVDILNQSV